MALSRSIRRPLRRFAQVDRRRRLLVIEAVACLLVARLALIFVPFPRLARRLGTFVPPNDPRAAPSPNGKAGALTPGAGNRLGGDARGTPPAVQGGVSAAGHGRPNHAAPARRGQRHAFRRRARAGETARRARLARRRGVEVTGYPVDPRFAEIACFV